MSQNVDLIAAGDNTAWSSRYGLLWGSLSESDAGRPVSS